mmetsp:Transcript_56768/g.136363  ORF Transcript_56768/g.136363 Transcript_56768/m.136363 type:complete len:231 (+) Transcript_56768:494-1186(+)
MCFPSSRTPTKVWRRLCSCGLSARLSSLLASTTRSLLVSARPLSAAARSAASLCGAGWRARRLVDALEAGVIVAGCPPRMASSLLSSTASSLRPILEARISCSFVTRMSSSLEAAACSTLSGTATVSPACCDALAALATDTPSCTAACSVVATAAAFSVKAPARCRTPSSCGTASCCCCTGDAAIQRPVRCVTGTAPSSASGLEACGGAAHSSSREVTPSSLAWLAAIQP